MMKGPPEMECAMASDNSIDDEQMEDICSAPKSRIMEMKKAKMIEKRSEKFGDCMDEGIDIQEVKGMPMQRDMSIDEDEGEL